MRSYDAVAAVKYWAVPAESNARSYPPSPKDHGSKNMTVHDLPEQMAALDSPPSHFKYVVSYLGSFIILPTQTKYLVEESSGPACHH